MQKKILMRVTSEYGKGWFILEDENGMTDMDFIQEDGTVQENLFNRKIRGKDERRGREISIYEW